VSKSPHAMVMLDTCSRLIMEMSELDGEGGCDWSAPEHTRKMLEHAQDIVKTITEYISADCGRP
jgi:hypothetical protein